MVKKLQRCSRRLLTACLGSSSSSCLFLPWPSSPWLTVCQLYVKQELVLEVRADTPQSKRLFHILTSFITTFATISYYAMATKGGISYNTIEIVEHTKDGFPDFVTAYQSREVYWARYVDCQWCPQYPCASCSHYYRECHYPSSSHGSCLPCWSERC